MIIIPIILVSLSIILGSFLIYVIIYRLTTGSDPILDKLNKILRSRQNRKIVEDFLKLEIRKARIIAARPKKG